MDKNLDPGSVINIPDPQHWPYGKIYRYPTQNKKEHKEIIFNVLTTSDLPDPQRDKMLSLGPD